MVETLFWTVLGSCHSRINAGLHLHAKIGLSNASDNLDIHHAHLNTACIFKFKCVI